MAFELFTKNKNHHILHSLLNRKWTYISYIPEVYYKKGSSSNLVVLLLL